MTRFRRAFTVLEVVVAIAISGLLLALALPALMGLREAAARIRCQDHLHNQALAVLAYESTHGSMPSGAIQGPFQGIPTGVGHGLYPALLPHLDEGALALAYRWEVSFDDPANQAAAAAPIAVLLCPSSGSGAPVGQPAVSDYGPLEVNPLLIDLALVDPSVKCAGALPFNSRLRMVDITDGTAYTLLVVEAPAANPWASPCTLVGVRQLVPGADGGNHRGGVNVSTCDGSVHFLRAGTDLQTVARLATRDDGQVVTVDW